MSIRRLLAIVLAVVASAAAQGPPHGGGPPPGGPRGGPGSRGGPGHDGPPSDFLSGKWWTSPEVVRRIGLTDDQQKRIEQVFQQDRVQLIDLRAALEKEEATLDPMLTAEHPQESAVLAQIDRIANARAELEKANARMLFAFRLVLSPDQWKSLQPGNRQRRMP